MSTFKVWIQIEEIEEGGDGENRGEEIDVLECSSYEEAKGFVDRIEALVDPTLPKIILYTSTDENRETEFSGLAATIPVEAILIADDYSVNTNNEELTFYGKSAETYRAGLITEEDITAMLTKVREENTRTGEEED